MLGAAALSACGRGAKRPNIVLIMADDMGFSDLGCYGGEIETPNLDALARNGLRFAQFYNTARCCPTRASLLTGLYPHQAGVGHMVNPRENSPGYRGDLARESVTIAEALKPAGYNTLMSGKWHVTPVTDSKHNWPLQRGFDRFYGTIHGAGSFYDPATLAEGNDYVEPDKPEFNYTDAISDRAAAFVREYAAKPEPFFLYVPYTAPHWPLHEPESGIAKYKGRYAQGWDALRMERHQNMIRMGLVDVRWPLTPRDPDAPAWPQAKDKEWQQRRMEVYAAQVDRMDQGIGRIVAALRESEAEENTLILFLADNGGCAEELRENPRQPRARHVPEKTRAGEPVQLGNDPQVMPGPENTYQSYGIPWANASNTPFRLYKHWVHEGGISSPLIAHWPARIKNPGTITNEPGHVIDLMATCVDAAGAKYPQEFAGTKITPLEGKSLIPVLAEGRREGHSEIYWEHEGNRAVRQGKWKLVSRHPGEWELYDLDADRTELDDLSAKEPAKVAELAANYDAWARKCGVEPWT
ncbi:MAG: arylsulfatase [Bryobacterales bacterium]|nr:arylsulfatase [Bryobacterales bacterium]